LALVETDAWPNETWVARIERIGEVVDPVTRRIQVRCSVDNRGDRLKPEMFARVTLLGDANDQAVRVPNSAIITQGIYTQVFVEVSTGVFERRRVSLRLQDRDFAYLGSEVSAGERIVVAGALLLNSELLESR
jgi:cobalt-zinc-cadmium efflux system membrane fusion protein